VLRLLGREDDYLPEARETANTSRWRQAAIAFLSGDLAGAADIYADIGAEPDEAYTRLSLAEVLLGEGRRSEADLELEKAMAFWSKAGATAYLRQGEALLAEAS
jgi:thioredoxin-like negative regulator of GroEL